ncbi:MAG: hypothetical protein ACXADS_13310 [Candidatus Thorarchaeota archaeon]|jgi:rubrerythrin
MVETPNVKVIASALIFIGGTALAIYGFLEFDVFHIYFGGGILIAVVAIVLYVKRSRWGYWYSMLTGKRHIETYIRHDTQEYDSMNQEPNLERGRTMEKLAIGLIWVVSLGGQMLMPFLGFELMAIIAGISIVAALGLFVMKKILGYYEYKEHASESHVILEYIDLAGNDGELFFEDIRFSKRLIVDQEGLVRTLDSIDKQLQTMRTEMTAAGAAALKELPTDIRDQIEKIQSLAGSPDELEFAVQDRLKASAVVRKFFRVGIDQDVTFDYVEEDMVRDAIKEENEREDAKKKKGKKDTNPKAKTKIIEEKIPKEKHFVCRLCGDTLEKSKSDDFFFKCPQCDKNTNAAYVLVGPVYEPHAYTAYPGGELKRRCILVFPVRLNDALDPNAKLRVRFNYEAFMARAHYIRGIKLGPLKEILYDGEQMDGIPIDLPEGITTLDTEVPVFIVTDFDYAEKRRLAGLQMVRPPPLISHFIRLVKAIIQVSIMGRKLEDKEIEVSKLQESRSRLRSMYEALLIEKEMEKPDILPPAMVPEASKEPAKPKSIRRLQMVALSIIWFAIGSIFTLVILPILGYTIVPPVVEAVGALSALMMQDFYGNPIPLWLFILVLGGLSGASMLFVERKFLKLTFLALTCLILIVALLTAIFNPLAVVG